MNNELERVWQEAVMTSSEVLSGNLLGETEGNHKNNRQEGKICIEIRTWDLPIRKPFHHI
jgi:hypothetical protein